MKRVIERLLNLLAFLLTAGRPVTADEIRTTVAGYDQESDVAFHRMFERDKDLLRNLGIPLEVRPTDRWEVEFGYVVPPDAYEMPDPELTDEERASLWLAAQIVRLGGQPSGPEALLKLGGGPLTAAGEPLAASLGSGSEDLAVAFAAALERRLLRFTYHDRRRQVQPYGLVHRRGHWYLVGAEKGEVRAFRVDRGHGFEAGEEPGAFQRPDGFRMREAVSATPWEAGDQELEAVVQFDPAVAWWAERQLPTDAPRERTAQGAIRSRLRVANVDAFLGWMIGFEDQAEILEPPALRAAMVARLEERE